MTIWKASPYLLLIVACCYWLECIPLPSVNSCSNTNPTFKKCKSKWRDGNWLHIHFLLWKLQLCTSDTAGHTVLSKSKSHSQRRQQPCSWSWHRGEVWQTAWCWKHLLRGSPQPPWSPDPCRCQWCVLLWFCYNTHRATPSSDIDVLNMRSFINHGCKKWPWVEKKDLTQNNCTK